jgi:integrase
LNGRDIYLGRYGTPECQAAYHRVIAEWVARGRLLQGAVDETTSTGTNDLTINEMLLAYLQHADTHYLKNGQPTSEPVNIRLALRPLRELYGDMLAREFGPRRLKAVRQAMVNSGLCRNEINKRVRHVLRAFKWAVGEELVPPSVHHGLKAVPGLRRGRADVRESKPVKPVPVAFIDAIRPHVSRQVWAMVQLQHFTGMRPGEVIIMRTCDLDMTGKGWRYTPESHKTEHHGRLKRIPLGPEAREILRTWLRPELTAYLFSPAEAEAERHAEQRESRKTRVQPSQQNRRRRKPRKAPGQRYTVDSYRRAIRYGIKWANQEAERVGADPIPHWHPHQIRHTAATRFRNKFGLDVAQAILGHSTPVVTAIYAELDEAKAAAAMELVG